MLSPQQRTCFKMKTVHRVAHLVWDEDFANQTFDQLVGDDGHESDNGEDRKEGVRSETTLSKKQIAKQRLVIWMETDCRGCLGFKQPL